MPFERQETLTALSEDPVNGGRAVNGKRRGHERHRPDQRASVLVQLRLTRDFRGIDRRHAVFDPEFAEPLPDEFRQRADARFGKIGAADRSGIGAEPRAHGADHG